MAKIINVYDDNDNVVKTCEATEATIKFGAIRSIMKLLNVDDIDDTGKLLKTIYKAWDELTKVLSKCFPDMSDEDWDNVKLNELVPVVVQILKDSFSEILKIPNDPKN